MAHNSRTCTFIAIVRHLPNPTHVPYELWCCCRIVQSNVFQTCREELGPKLASIPSNKCYFPSHVCATSSCTLFLQERTRKKCNNVFHVRVRCKKCGVSTVAVDHFPNLDQSWCDPSSCWSEEILSIFKPAMFSPNMSSMAEPPFLCRPFPRFVPKMRSPSPCSCQDIGSKAWNSTTSQFVLFAVDHCEILIVQMAQHQCVGEFDLRVFVHMLGFLPRVLDG